MDSPRVLHIVKRMDIAGGAERIVAELVKQVPAHDVLIYSGGNSFYDLGDAKILRARSFMHAVWMAHRLRRRYARFHLHLFPSTYMAVILGKRSIIHEHNSHNARRDIAAFRPLEWLVYRRARAIVAISDATRSALEAWIGRRETISVVPNFVPKLVGPDTLAMAKPKDAGYKIAMVASFTDQKRQELLIEAMRLLPDDVEVVFVGEGPNLERCRKLAEERGVVDRLRFLGAVRDIVAIYRSVDLCVLMSHWEGFGLVVLEAAQFGVPTIVSNVPGLRDICPDQRLVLTKDTPEALAAKIVETLPGSRSSEARRALIAHAEKHSIERYVRELNEVYE